MSWGEGSLTFFPNTKVGIPLIVEVLVLLQKLKHLILFVTYTIYNLISSRESKCETGFIDIFKNGKEYKSGLFYDIICFM